jgi:hypothetical protein
VEHRRRERFDDPELRQPRRDEAVRDPRLDAAAVIGNQAFTRVARTQLQRLSTKPRTPGGLQGTLEILEKGVREDDYDTASRGASFLHASSPLYYVDLLRYKLTKHAAGTPKGELYLDSAPEAARLTTLQVACEHGERRVVSRLWDYVFSLTASQRMALIRRCDPAFFITHVLRPARERRPGHLVPVLQETDLTAYLEAHAPIEYGAFAADTPQLRVVGSVKAAAGEGAHSRDIVDRIFAAVLTNSGIDVAYIATATIPTEHALTGVTQASQAHRAALLPLMPNLPAIPATDCHHLLSIFETILKSYPDLDADIERETDTKAVMTIPLAGTPGGLIRKDFGGNVFDDAGAFTGRIFFTGEDGVNSHSWLKVNSRRYDILFGTTGSAVKAGVGGRFVKTKLANVYREDGGGRYLIVDATRNPPANPYSFSTAYRLTDDPATHGIDLTSL